MNFNSLNHKFVAYFQHFKTFIHLFIKSEDFLTQIQAHISAINRIEPFLHEPSIMSSVIRKKVSNAINPSMTFPIC